MPKLRPICRFSHTAKKLVRQWQAILHTESSGLPDTTRFPTTRRCLEARSNRGPRDGLDQFAVLLQTARAAINARPERSIAHDAGSGVATVKSNPYGEVPVLNS
jgi:hypothetical protein